jgi:heat shock protein HslJ
MEGFAGCNRYSVKMEIKDNTFIFDDDGALVTDLLCVSPEGIMSQEKEYVMTLTSIVTYSRSDNRLEMKNENRDVVLIFEKGRPNDFHG